jgi:argininosuccinate synthase
MLSQQWLRPLRGLFRSSLRSSCGASERVAQWPLLGATFSTGPSTPFNKTEFRKPDPSKPRLVLAYSGGLDTSTQLSYLVNEKGFEVCAYIADMGQDETLNPKDVEEICAKAETSGAYAFYCEDVRREFVTDFVFPTIRASVLYEGRYLMGTSVARPMIGKRQMEVVAEEGAQYVSHGSTGKGNDQVRFELCYYSIDPQVECVTLWRDPVYLDKFKGRLDLIDYATKMNIPVGATKKHSYSEDENLMHISYESGELEDPAYPGNGEEYPGLVLKKKTRDINDCPDTPARLTIDFERGDPTRVYNWDDGTTVTDPLELYLYLNEIGGVHGVGRIDIVENRFVGMKSRGCYETPGGTILYHAHLDLETLTMDREVMRIRDSLSLKFAELVYNGYWYSPEMEFVRNSLDYAQRTVTGSVDIQLHKANVINRGRSSPLHSLYNQDLVSMDMEGGFDATQSTGFIKTLSTRIKANKRRDDQLKAHGLID